MPQTISVYPAEFSVRGQVVRQTTGLRAIRELAAGLILIKVGGKHTWRSSSTKGDDAKSLIGFRSRKIGMNYFSDSEN